MTEVGLIVPTEPVVLVGVTVVVGITVDPEVVVVVDVVGIEAVVDVAGVEVVAEVEPVEPVVNAEGEITGDTVLVAVFVVVVEDAVVEAGATDPEVIVLVGAIAVVTTGLTAIGELTAVVP